VISYLLMTIMNTHNNDASAAEDSHNYKTEESGASEMGGRRLRRQNSLFLKKEASERRLSIRERSRGVVSEQQQSMRGMLKELHRSMLHRNGSFDRKPGPHSIAPYKFQESTTTSLTDSMTVSTQADSFSFAERKSSLEDSLRFRHSVLDDSLLGLPENDHRQSPFSGEDSFIFEHGMCEPQRKKFEFSNKSNQTLDVNHSSCASAGHHSRDLADDPRERGTELSRDDAKPSAQDYSMDSEEMGFLESQNSSIDRTIRIEVAPGIELRLRGSKETWAAIKECRITVTSCCCCLAELHCIEDAELVVCPDCWVVSPVDQSIGGIPIEGDNNESDPSVSLGVKVEDTIRWLSERGCAY
jgi:hypothetical protein